MKMLYLAAPIALTLSAMPVAASMEKTVHGLQVHSLKIGLNDRLDPEEAQKAFDEKLKALYEDGWADTPAKAWEGVEETPAGGEASEEGQAAIDRLAAIEGDGEDSAEDIIAQADAEIESLATQKDEAEAAIKPLQDEVKTLKAELKKVKTAAQKEADNSEARIKELEGIVKDLEAAAKPDSKDA